MLKPTLCFALPFEAKPWLKLSGAKAINQSKQIGYYQSERFDILISGVGTYKMAAAVGWLFGQGNNKRILFNIGLSGSANFSLYNWVIPHSVAPQNNEQKPFYPEILFKSELNTCKLLTLNTPASRDYLANLRNTIVDMEAYGFAKSAQQFIPSTQIHFLKFISDDGADQEIDLNILQDAYENKLHTAIAFIEQTSEILNRDFTKKELNFSEKQHISEKLKLTFSQQVQLENVIRYVYFYGLENRLTGIDSFLNEEIKNKYQRNAILENILHKLYHG